jgi:hypothetical protein
MNASALPWTWLTPEHAVTLALGIVALELVVRLLWALRGPRRPGWPKGVWHSLAGAALLLALGEAMALQRTTHLLSWLALAGLAHGLALLPPTGTNRAEDPTSAHLPR